MNKIYDNSTYGLHSEACTAITNTSPRIGATCAEFRGANYITIPRLAMLTGPMTMNIWAYMDNWAEFTSKDMRIISCTEAGGWNIEPTYFGLYDAGASAYKSIYVGTKISTLSSGWHMFTLTFDGTCGRAYIDTELIATGGNFVNAPYGKIGYHASNRIFIGSEAGGSTTPVTVCKFTGKVDDLKIYASCLSAEDIQKEYKTRGYVSNLGQLFVSWIDEVGSNKLKSNTSGIVQGVENSPEGYLYPKPDITLVGSHIYYVSILGNTNYGFRTVDFFWPETGTGFRGNIETGSVNTWKLFSWRFQGSVGNGGTIADGSYHCRFDFNNGGSGVAKMQFKNAKVIDLTEIYGAGNEPTKDECDSIFNKSNQIVDRSGVCKPVNNICEMGRRLRYIRLSMDGSNENTGNHLNKLSYTTIDETTTILCDRGKSISMLNGSVVSGGITPNTQSPQETGW